MACVIMHNIIVEDEIGHEMEPIIVKLIHVLWRRRLMRRELNFKDYVRGHEMI